MIGPLARVRYGPRTPTRAPPRLDIRAICSFGSRANGPRYASGHHGELGHSAPRQAGHRLDRHPAVAVLAIKLRSRRRLRPRHDAVHARADRRGDHGASSGPCAACRTRWPYLIIAFSFGARGRHRRPQQGLVVLHLVPDLGRRAGHRAGRGGALPLRARRGPPPVPAAAGRIVKLHDAICMRCGHELDFPEVGDRARIGRTPALDSVAHRRPAILGKGVRAAMMRAVDAIMECLKAEGVDVVFGYPGGANLPTYDAMYDSGIHHILVRHEAGGGHAAEGYAKASGQGRRVLRHLRPGRDEHRHAAHGRDDGLRARWSSSPARSARTCSGRTASRRRTRSASRCRSSSTRS